MYLDRMQITLLISDKIFNLQETTSTYLKLPLCHHKVNQPLKLNIRPQKNSPLCSTFDLMMITGNRTGKAKNIFFFFLQTCCLGNKTNIPLNLPKGPNKRKTVLWWLHCSLYVEQRKVKKRTKLYKKQIGLKMEQMTYCI